MFLFTCLEAILVVVSLKINSKEKKILEITVEDYDRANRYPRKDLVLTPVE